MKKTHSVIAITAALLLAAPAIAHDADHADHMGAMVGTVVGTDKTGPVVCIGSSDGAKVGQLLEVYHVSAHVGPNKSGIPMYHRQLVGHVRIDHVFDEHFAHVRVTDGRVLQNDIVELQQS
jgi:ribosomal protein S6E (S10)